MFSFFFYYFIFPDNQYVNLIIVDLFVQLAEINPASGVHSNESVEVGIFVESGQRGFDLARHTLLVQFSKIDVNDLATLNRTLATGSLAMAKTVGNIWRSVISGPQASDKALIQKRQVILCK